MWFVIGYGSPLHSDDRLGWTVAEGLETALDPTIAEIVACSQLTLELSEPISRAEGVIFVDANAESPPGQITCQHLPSIPNPFPHQMGERELRAVDSPPLAFGRGAGSDGRSTFTHHVTPQALLDAAYALYGIAPPGWLYSIGVAKFDLGETLSYTVAEAIPMAIEQISERIRMSCTNSASLSNS